MSGHDASVPTLNRAANTEAEKSGRGPARWCTGGAHLVYAIVLIHLVLRSSAHFPEPWVAMKRKTKQYRAASSP